MAGETKSHPRRSQRLTLGSSGDGLFKLFKVQKTRGVAADELADEAIEIANGTPFGLAGFVQSKDLKRARKVADRIRAGRVYLNGAPFDRALPFGGYKQSGNGREFGVFGFEEYLEVKALLGFPE